MADEKYLHDRTARLSLSTDDDTPSLSASQRSSNHLTRTNIREANQHLQMLYARNQELEEIIQKQNEELNRKDQDLKNLSRTSQVLERHCQQLQTQLDERTRRLLVYERREALFREALELKPAVESLLDVLTSFEQIDQTNSNSSSTGPSNTTPLQFVQSSAKKNTNHHVFHRTDAV